MNFLITFFISFVVLSCGLRETSRVDYTERRKTAREKRKNVCFHHYITCGPPQREEILRKILGGLLNFISFQYATMNE